MNSNRIQINIGVRHKTSDNIKLRNAFTVGIADEKNLVAADYVGIVSGHDVPDKIEKSGFHTVRSEFVDAPVIEELPISLECKVKIFWTETGRLIRRSFMPYLMILQIILI